MKVLKKVFGSKNERELKRMLPIVARVNEFEASIRLMSDEAMKQRTAELRQQVEKGQPLNEIMPEAFALVREASIRTVGMRHFDVQIIGGIVLHEGKIAEMKTGEGKTLVATMPSYLNALTGKGVHVVTVNDYLAQRDAEWMGRIHRFLGLSVGVIVHGLNDSQRQHSYGSDITYGTNNEFGFDYLRDNMKFDLKEYVQRDLNFAIVDEVDSILIDEARTPLIISGPTDESTDKYYKINAIIPGLRRDEDYTVDEKSRTVVLTDAGVIKTETRLNVKNLYDPRNIEVLHHVTQGLRAHTLYRNEVDYVVKDGQVMIVDEFTGRLMEGRRWSDGLHQAVEAKEGVRIQNENQTLATISFQNYFRLYGKLCGMTGTAETEAAEFFKTYKIEVVVIPTNLPLIRTEHPDVVYKTEREKFNAIVEDLKEAHEKGQPVLVGTIAIEKSEHLAKLLKQRGVPHHVLNAKHHEHEAEIVAQAGRKGAITVSTNMAGRGTDILLGGNPEYLAKSRLGRNVDEHSNEYHKVLQEFRIQCQQEHDLVVSLGGLHILGSERHEARRIDNQLRGRAGRQGDPGSSRFYLSLEDDLMRIFGAERISSIMERLGMEEGVPIEHGLVSRAIESAQRKVEGQNFEARKQLLEYDDVMNQQRKAIYALRRRVLEGETLRETIFDSMEDTIMAYVSEHCPAGKNPEDWDYKSLGEACWKTFAVRPELDNVEPNREQIQDVVWDTVEKTYQSKISEYTEESMVNIEQWIYLDTIDTLWKDHLLAMDHMREGIGLRGYGQRDPKLEYKREGFSMFEDMMFRIKSNVLEKLFRVQIDFSEEAEEFLYEHREQENLSYTHSDYQQEEESSQEKAQPVRRTLAKVGRNEPCPCGSGKKYKKCCLLKDTGSGDTRAAG